jgi:uncharacterized protein
MIILFSPAKTFKASDAVFYDRPLFEIKASKLITKLKRMSVDDIQRKMKVSQKLATEVHQYYQTFGKKQYCAIHSYHGQAYKALDIQSIPDDVVSTYNDKIYILSGLYGLIRPLDGISYYRLEMKDQSITNLYQYWQKDIYRVLTSSDVIINLSSKEYDHVIDSKLPMVTIQFMIHKNGLITPPGMELKTMRGLFLRHMMINDIKDVSSIKHIEINGYRYDPSLSDQKKLTFIKQA